MISWTPLLNLMPALVRAAWMAFLAVITYGTSRMGFPAMFDVVVTNLYGFLAVLMPWLPTIINEIATNSVVQSILGFMASCADVFVEFDVIKPLALDALLVYLGCRYVCPIAGIFMRFITLRLLL